MARAQSAGMTAAVLRSGMTAAVLSAGATVRDRSSRKKRKLAVVHGDGKGARFHMTGEANRPRVMRSAESDGLQLLFFVCRKQTS